MVVTTFNYTDLGDLYKTIIDNLAWPFQHMYHSRQYPTFGDSDSHKQPAACQASIVFQLFRHHALFDDRQRWSRSLSLAGSILSFPKLFLKWSEVISLTLCRRDALLLCSEEEIIFFYCLWCFSKGSKH